MLRCSTTQAYSLVGRRSITSVSHYRHGEISTGTTHGNQHRKAARGGQNLSARYVRLEKSIRQKASFSKDLEEFSERDAALPENLQARVSPSKPNPAPLFHGFQVPEEPKPPADDECCMSGCAVCVYDLHEESLEAYKEAVAKLRSSLSALNIPVVEWPAHIRPTGSTPAGGQETRKGAILNAFEEMERKLALKRAEEQPDVTTVSNPDQWKKRREIVAVKKAEARDSLVTELYETLRWIIFSGR